MTPSQHPPAPSSSPSRGMVPAAAVMTSTGYMYSSIAVAVVVGNNENGRNNVSFTPFFLDATLHHCDRSSLFRRQTTVGSK